MQVAFQRFRNGVRIERECFTLRDEEITQMFGFFELLQSRGLLIEEDGEGFRFSPELARQVLEDGAALSNFARTHPEVLQTIIQSEISAPDVIALAHRKNVLEQFDQLLHDESAFELAEQATGGPENTWQSFFEDNPWIVGGTLAPQFLHSFEPNRLEQTVRGFSIASGGRRADAVLRTAGAISAIVLVEIKHHKTSLLAASPYRSDYWNVGKDVIGGVAQCQATVDAAEREFGSHLEMTDELGGIIDEVAVCRPRSLLVVGSLSEFHENDRFNRAKYESFERFRRSLRDPEIVTFDELFERARIMLELSIEGPGEEA
jgi:hypothetical protein